MSAEPMDTDHPLWADLPDRPYPGLRPFEASEWTIFFGRERMTEDIIHRLMKDRLVVVHGDSGCGKSSLIAAGVLPRLEQEATRGNTRWLTCSSQPGEQPLWNLARAISALRKEHDETQTVAVRRLLNFGRSGGEALSKFLTTGENCHVCILVDQFEELFAHARRHGSTEAKLLIELLIGVMETRPPGLCAVVTMRSEFLGNCAAYPAFAETVNAAQYLLPRMEHADLIRAIREPATLYNGNVTRELAERLIDDAGGSQNQLPLIQHGLMQLHRRHVLERNDRGDAEWTLGLNHYDRAAGNLSSLLSNHADEVVGFAESSTDDMQGRARIAESVFRALTDINADGQAIRRPQTLGKLVAVANSDEARVRAIIDSFRVEGVSFLRPYGDEPLTLDARIDISHEALIRCWKHVADCEVGWLRREFEDGLIWRSLLVQADSFIRDPSNVLSSATTRERTDWLVRRNDVWCQRYGGRWNDVTRLLDASLAEVTRQERAEQEARKAAEIAREKERKLAQRIRSTRNLSIALTLIIAFAFAALGFAWVAFSAKREVERRTLEAEGKVRELALARLATEEYTRVASDAITEANDVQARTKQLEASAQDTLSIALKSLSEKQVLRSANSTGATAKSEALSAIKQLQETLKERATAPLTPATDNRPAPLIYFQISDSKQSAAVRVLVELMRQRRLDGRRLLVISPLGVLPSDINAFRCFRRAECEEAKRLLELINSFLISPKLVLQDFSAQFETSTAIRPWHYEIWLTRGEIKIAQ